MIAYPGTGAVLLLMIAATTLPSCAPSPTAAASRLIDLPIGRWVKIHQQTSADPVIFRRQRHGGSVFDGRRGRLVLFGSDTHGNDWSNSPLYFDVMERRWSRAYADDDPSSYAVDDQGHPVAGRTEHRPWAMHTFGAVVYDPVADALVVASYPAHLEPGRFTDAVVGVWHRIRRHPTWVFEFATGRWKALPVNPEHFYAFAAVYDPDRRVVIGYRSDGIYEMTLPAGAWVRVAGGGVLGWHANAVYDNRNKALVVFGSNEDSNDVVVYQPATRRHSRMPTPGVRPPGDRHVPMAFHSRLGRTVALVDRRPDGSRDRDRRRMCAETWLYDVGADAWQRVETATLPFGTGMNYNLEYDPDRDLLWLVAEPPGEATAVWALRL